MFSTNVIMCRRRRIRFRWGVRKTLAITLVLALYCMGALIIPKNSDNLVSVEEYVEKNQRHEKPNIMDDPFIKQLFVEPTEGVGEVQKNESEEPNLYEEEQQLEPAELVDDELLEAAPANKFHSRFVNQEEIEKLFFAQPRDTEPSNENLPIKTILYYNEDHSGGNRYYGLGGLGKDIFRRNGCPIWQCEVYDYLMENITIPEEEFDAIVFHDPTWYDHINDRPSNRSIHQRYVYWNQEAPSVYSRWYKWDEVPNFFNLTMTHRWDSDIPHPYGWIVPLRPESVPMNPNKAQLQELIDATSTGKNYAAKKTKLAAWFVSNCNAASGRDEYIRRLSEFVQVDVYGKCGTLNCPKDKNEECRKMMERDYKFHISFENSLCVDYVTEKFFQQMQYNTIPIVLDLHDNHKQFAPPHSYINALDFPSIKELADYLSLLDRNDTLYNQYFWWKEHYEIRNKPTDFRHGLCRLCSILHEDEFPNKSYADLTDWWDVKAECRALRFEDDSVNATDGKYPSHYWTSELIPRYKNIKKA